MDALFELLTQLDVLDRRGGHEGELHQRRFVVLGERAAVELVASWINPMLRPSRDTSGAAR
jgi:hypothetical protein